MVGVMTLWCREYHPLTADTLRSWTLAFHCAAKHFLRMILVCDSQGKEVLVKRLLLPFDEVDTRLDTLPNTHVWAACKLTAYTVPTEAFCHLDHDVFLWEPLPARLTSAGVFAQHREVREYPWKVFDRSMSYAVPWRGSPYNVGIVGGNDLDFLRRYAEAGLAAIFDARNAPALARMNGTIASLQFEQHGLGCLAWHLGRTVVPLLSPNTTDAIGKGYTHLMAESKHRPRFTTSIRNAVQIRHPDFSRRIDEITTSL